MTDELDEVKDDAELEEKEELEDPIGDELPPPNIGEEDDVDDDEAVIAEGFSPVEGEEPAEFDPEDPDAYLYNTPQVKYSDSAEEDERDWVDQEEF